MKSEWLIPAWLLGVGLAIYANGCAATMPSGVAKMQFNHLGKQTCAFYLPSDQDADTGVYLRVHPGECPDTITDEPVAPSP